MPKHYPTSEAAKLLGVHPQTLRRWAREGHIKYIRHPVNKWRLFPLSEINRIRVAIGQPPVEDE